MNPNIYLQAPNGQIIPIPVGEAIIGRQPDNPIVIEGQGVSRQHAKISRQDNQVTIIDLNSSNGIYVNGQKLSPHVAVTLANGDEVRLGQQIKFIFYGDAISIEKTTLEPVVMPHFAVNPPPQPAWTPSPAPMPMQQFANKPDLNTAVVLEILGIFGLMGIGWIYTGNTGLGLLC